MANEILKRSAIALAITSAFSGVNVMAADAGQSADDDVEVIEVRGMLSSLKRSMLNKKEADIVSDGISAEDLGKFPDLNVAESLQRITGVSIDRSGGEGQAVTVRGFGPQFNTVLVNGRQLATDSAGREFNFDILAADQITGADIFKTSQANFQEGGIGGTVNVKTARPFDYKGFQAVVSAKGMYESLSEEVSPSVSALVSNTFADESMGVLLAVSHQERDVQINRIETAGWRSGQTIQNKEDGVLFANAYIPRNWDQIVDNQERTRTNASLVFQFAPSDELSITFDGFVSIFEVDSEVTDLASWFEPDRVKNATIDQETGTLLTFDQRIGISGVKGEDGTGSGNPASDFVSHTRNSRDVSNQGFGLNVEWHINDQLSANFDVSTSSAENDRAGRDRFNVVGIINNYSFDGTGKYPTVEHDGFVSGSLPDASLSRLHYNEKGNRFTDEDEITEYKADFIFEADGDVFTQARFGAYRQEREKSSFQIFGNQCEYCGYGVEAPNNTIGFESFTAQNFFPGLIDTFYAYDGDAYVDFLGAQGFPIEPTLQNNRYTINEDITSLYMDFTFQHELGDMPLSVNAGVRYAKTSIAVDAVQSFISDVVTTSDETLFKNEFGPATNITEGGDYGNLLSSINAKLELAEDKVLRFAVYDSLTRPTMSDLSPATTFGEPRRQNLTASGGNPNLRPFKAENWDLSFEWYYADTSSFTFAVFNKEVEDFIVTLQGDEVYTMTDRLASNGFACGNCEDDDDSEELNGQSETYKVSRPQNGETATVTGYEVAVTHVFDSGFGVTANATVVDSNVSVDPNVDHTFALEGLGDSQNLILFYEQDGFQARIAYNHRERFLRYLDNSSAGGFTGEPVNGESFGQIDISASYDINESLTVFFEGINIGEEELKQTGRFRNQVYTIEDNGSRYALGVRAKF